MAFCKEVGLFGTSHIVELAVVIIVADVAIAERLPIIFVAHCMAAWKAHILYWYKVILVSRSRQESLLVKTKSRPWQP